MHKGERCKLVEKRFTEDGWLIVSELHWCQHFEKEKSATHACRSEDCFFCKFSDFRKPEYIEQVESEARKGVLYSICHNEKNRKLLQQTETEIDSETNC